MLNLLPIDDSPQLSTSPKSGFSGLWCKIKYYRLPVETWCGSDSCPLSFNLTTLKTVDFLMG